MSYDSPSEGSSPNPAIKFEPTTASESSTAWLEHPEHPRLYKPEPNILALTRSIADLPLIRPLNLRLGKNVFYLHNLSHGISNYKAILAYQRGKVQSVTCSCCTGSQPMGPFQQCVVLGNVHLGACTNCAYDGNGTRCTLRLFNADGTPINPNSCKRKIGLSRAQTVDHASEEVVNVETGAIERSRSTPRDETGQRESPSANIGYLRRQAAKDAESRLSDYTHHIADVGGSIIDSSDADTPAQHTPINGWADDEIVVSDLPQPDAPRPRGSFMAKRGGKHSHMRKKSSPSGEDAKRARTATLEGNDKSEEDEPAPQRRRLYTSPSPEEEDEIHVTIPNSAPVPDNLRLHDIPLPARLITPTSVMKHLLTLPALRTVSWRENASRSLNINSQIEAAMGYCVGEIVPPCDRCSRDKTSFQKCVTVRGHFQQSCVGCTYTSRASQCTFHVPNSTRHGVVILDAPPKTLATKKSNPKMKASPAHLPDNSPNPSSTPLAFRKTIQPSAKPEAPFAAQPSINRPAILPPIAAKKESPMPTIRSQRYLRALADTQQMSQEEQQLELAELKFQAWVISNVIGKTAPATTTSRYKQAQVEYELMSREEQELELAGFKFRLAVLQDVLKSKGRA